MSSRSISKTDAERSGPSRFGGASDDDDAPPPPLFFLPPPPPRTSPGARPRWRAISARERKRWPSSEKKYQSCDPAVSPFRRGVFTARQPLTSSAPPPHASMCFRTPSIALAASAPPPPAGGAFFFGAAAAAFLGGGGAGSFDLGDAPLAFDLGASFAVLAFFFGLSSSSSASRSS